MPEATVLYTVTAVVVLGLVVWVAAVLKTAREPWARPYAQRHSGIESLPPAKSQGDPSGGADGGGPTAETAPRDAATPDADATTKATPVALAGEAKGRGAAKDDNEGDVEA